MKTREVTNTLKKLGWSSFADEVGDRYTQFILPDRIIQIIYGVRKYGNQQQLEAMYSLSTELFSEFCAVITSSGEIYAPLVRCKKGICYLDAEINIEHVERLSVEVVSWAKKQDISQALQDYALLSTDAPGARPIWHLAALAILGDVAKLKSYQTSFEAGDRLGFVPYITKDYIERAIALSEDKIKSS